MNCVNRFLMGLQGAALSVYRGIYTTGAHKTKRLGSYVYATELSIEAFTPPTMHWDLFTTGAIHREVSLLPLRLALIVNLLFVISESRSMLH